MVTKGSLEVAALKEDIGLCSELLLRRHQGCSEGIELLLHLLSIAQLARGHDEGGPDWR